MFLGMNVINNLNMQLSEVEMLQSMYANVGEFEVDDAARADIAAFVASNCEGDILPPKLTFTVNAVSDHFLFCSLPHYYPDEDPELYVRSDRFSREEQHQLNEELRTFIAQRTPSDICICLAIQWLQDNITSKNAITSASSSSDFPMSSSTENHVSFLRHWIYSHHIYSKVKRKAILDMAKNLNVTGFCMPGKPGVICVEGASHNCNDFWKQLKLMSWKKITCIRTETEETDGNYKSCQRFLGFQEVAFESNRSSRDFHMDMGEFLKFLDSHKSLYMFKEYFGMDGKIALDG